MIKKTLNIRRILIFILGMFSAAFGVALSINAELGVSPVNSLPYVISRITEIPLSTCIIVTFCMLILIQFFILRKNFKIIYLAQILSSTIFGYFVDFSKWIIGDFKIPTYLGSLLMLAVSIVFIGTGVMLYVEVDVINMPAEGLTSALSVTFKRPFSTMKSLVDCGLVSMGVILCFIFFGRLDGIREGTIISAICTGYMLGIARKLLKNPVRHFCKMD